MFTRDDTADASGTSLYDTLDGVTLDQLLAAFGSPSRPGCDEEKGYRYEYRFRAADGGVVTLYDRWGTWRVGTGPRHGDDFVAWVRAAVASGRREATSTKGKVRVSPALAEAIGNLEKLLVCEFGPDFAFTIAGRGHTIAASTAVLGRVVPIV